MKRYVPRWFGLLLLVSLPVSGLAAQTGSRTGGQLPPSLNGLDEFVTGVMQEWHVPGLALGVIHDGKPVKLEGYGYRDVERKLPVTPQTLMAIGSNSKSFTAVLMGMLVDSGKLEWDEPVRNYLPDFQLYDEFATREMTPRDLVSHRSGLPRHDLLWYGRSFDREDLYRRLKYLEPNASFRSRWQYQNLMFMTAGYLVEEIEGRSWDDLIDQRIFEPLGMTRSNTSVTALDPARDDAAVAYVWRECPQATATGAGVADNGGARDPECGLVKVPYRNIDAVGPAGSINSSVEEMVRYIQMHVDSGRYRGREILSTKNTMEMQTPQMLVGSQEIWPDELGMAAYGLGLSVTSYRNRKLVIHGGGIDGFISQMAWLPRERIGVMVLTNMSGNNPVPNIVTRNVMDRMLGLDQIDWVGRIKQQQAEAEERRKKREEERAAERKPNTTPSHELAAYAGTYEHPAYGTLTVRQEGSSLTLSFDEFTVALKHFHYDVFEVDDPGNMVPLSGRLTFGLNTKGDIERLEVPFESNVSDIVFKRVES